MIRVLFVLGTRPEGIKLAPVIETMRRQPEDFSPRVCLTGQHRELLDDVLQIFGITPDVDLNLMQPGQGLVELSARLFAALGPAVEAEEPDWVLVQGDTTTAAIGSMVAQYLHVKVGHVEAGLRTGDRSQPFPEELNRRLVSVAADLHFAPTGRAKAHLLREGISERDIVVTGNTVIDALLRTVERPSASIDRLLHEIPESHRILMVTAHRRESFGAPLVRICKALRQLAEHHKDALTIVYAVHPNPHVCNPVHDLLGETPGIVLLPPVRYDTFVHLLRRAHLILTDSGGLQEEAPALGIPVLVLRDKTERPEAIDAGVARLVGTDPDRILREVTVLLGDSDAYRRMAVGSSPFGDGHASERICYALQAHSVANGWDTSGMSRESRTVPSRVGREISGKSRSVQGVR